MRGAPAEAPDILRRFQTSLRRHREQAGLTMPALGQALGVPRQRIYEMETGPYMPRLDTAYLAAAFFGEDLGTFLSGNETP